MSHAQPRRMEPDEFLQWCLQQEGKWELVNGVPVQLLHHAPGLPLELMAGATKQHDRIVVNLLIALASRLRDGPCEPHTDDIAARMVKGNIRRPDVAVDCQRGRDADAASTEPTVFFEVLSPSTQSFDFIIKSEEYKQLDSLRHFALIHPDRPRAYLWSRSSGDEGWAGREVLGLESVLPLPAIGIDLPMIEIYRAIEFPPEPPGIYG